MTPRAGPLRPLDAAVFSPCAAVAPGRWPAVGLSLSLPPGLHSLTVTVSGDALDAGALSPTVARVGRADTPRAPGDVWAGEALRRTHAGWSTHPFVLRVGDGRAGCVAVALCALVHRAVVGVVTLRVRVEGFGEAVGVVTLVPWEAPRVAFRYDAGCPSPEALARWCDADPTRAWVLDALGARARLSVLDARGRCVTGPCDAAAWREALRAVARGRARSVTVSGNDDGAGWSLGASLRGDGRPAERCAWWAPHDGAVPGAGPMPAMVQWGEGVAAEAPLPRVATAWEHARGVASLPVESAWLGRYARGPYTRGGCAARDGALVVPEATAWQRAELLGQGAAPRRAA